MIEVNAAARRVVAMIADVPGLLGSAPWSTVCFAVQTSDANRERTSHAVGRQLGNEAIFGHLAYVAEMFVAQSFVPTMFQLLLSR